MLYATSCSADLLALIIDTCRAQRALHYYRARESELMRRIARRDAMPTSSMRDFTVAMTRDLDMTSHHHGGVLSLLTARAFAAHGCRLR